MKKMLRSSGPQDTLHPMRKASRWWGLTLLICAVFIVLVQGYLRSRPVQMGLHLVRTEIPQTWNELPITARLTDEVVTSSDTGCNDGYGLVHHEGKLGPFRVRWSVYLYKGIDAGGRGWRVDAPDLRGSCPPSQDPEPGAPVRFARPDTLHEDATASLYVLEGYGQPMGACLKQQGVISPAYQASARDRILASGVAVVLVLAASVALRRKLGVS